jgi:ribose 5-phosphate isomerase B
MIAIASDHAGFALKQEIKALLESKKIDCKDFGTDSADSCDYAVYAYKAAKAVQIGECKFGILVCGTGVGMSLAANKLKGVRCALCTDTFTAIASRAHNDSNMLALGARVIGGGLACQIVEQWLAASFEGGRHARRIAQIHDIENDTPPQVSAGLV